MASLKATLGRLSWVLKAVGGLFPAVLAIGFASTPAHAAIGDSNCVHGGNYVSTACFYGSVQFGDTATWANDNLFVQSPPIEGHINQTLWSYSGNPCNLWVEVGLTYGFGPQGEAFAPIYGVYFAFQHLVNGATVYDHFFYTYQSIDASAHTYSLLYVGANTYAIEWTDNVTERTHVLAVIPGLGTGSCNAQVGLEEQNVGLPPNGDYAGGPFDATDIEWTDPGGGIHLGWANGEYWVDYPCGQGGLAPPNCLNARQYSAHEWGDGKP